MRCRIASAVAAAVTVVLAASSGAVGQPPQAETPAAAGSQRSRLTDPHLWRRLQQMSGRNNAHVADVAENAGTTLVTPSENRSTLPLPVAEETLQPVPGLAPGPARPSAGAVTRVPDWAKSITQQTAGVQVHRAIQQTSPTATDGREGSIRTNAPAFLDLNSSADSATVAPPGQAIQTDMLLRLATWTVIVLCLCVLTVLGIRRWQKDHGLLPTGQGNSQILETVMIGPNRSVCLVQLRDIQAVVGCDASGIQSIVLAPPLFDTAFADTRIGADAVAPETGFPD